MEPQCTASITKSGDVRIEVGELLNNPWFFIIKIMKIVVQFVIIMSGNLFQIGKNKDRKNVTTDLDAIQVSEGIRILQNILCPS